MQAKKSLGQNFLQDPEVIDQIVDALHLSSTDHVIEIGPGHGALTEKLVGRSVDVTAIEFDRDLASLLRERFGDRLGVIEADVLDVDLKVFVKTTAKLVGNLPYNISTPILQRLIDCRELFTTIVLMFQREVVERMTAPAGNSDRGFLTILTESAFRTEVLFDVPPTAFRPVPKVWSSVVRLTPKLANTSDEPHFRRLISIAFAHKRKTILNNLKHQFADAAAILASADIDPDRRAETLSCAEWTHLAKTLKEKKPDIW